MARPHTARRWSPDRFSRHLDRWQRANGKNDTDFARLVAERSGALTSPSAVGSWRSGTRPGCDNLYTIAAVLGLDCESFSVRVRL